MDFATLKQRMLLFASNFSYPIASILLIVIFGVWFASAIPPFQIADEQSHFGRLYGIVDGQHTIRPLPQGHFGYALPRSIGTFSWSYDARMDSGSHDVRDLNAHYKSVHFRDFQNEPKVELNLESVVAYSPVNYLPQIVALKISQALNLSLYGAIIFIKIFALLIFTLAVVGAYLLLPRKAWPILFVLTALPNVVEQAASISADSFTNTVVLLFMAAIVRCAVAKKESWLNLATLGFAGVMLVLLAFCKPIYVLFGLLLLVFVGPKVIKNPFVRYTSLLLIAGTSAVFAVWWNHKVSKIGMNYAVISGRHDVVPVAQLRSIIASPAHYWQVLINTFIFDIGNTARNWLGAFIGKIAARGPILPLEFQLLGFVAIGIALLRPSNEDEADETPSIAIHKIIIASLVGLAVALAIATVLYVTFTPLNAEYIMGLQGRYLIPISFMLLFVTMRHRAHGITMTMRSQQTFLVVASLINLALTTYEIKTFFIT